MKNSILNINVSCFANCHSTEPIDVNLLSWLNSDKYFDKVENLRSIQDAKLQKLIKDSLPAITPSGRFLHRSTQDLIEHSGLLAFDIDYKDNRHITNYIDLKEQISHISCVAYCGLSVSGNGYWGLVPIPKCNPEEHKNRFNALCKDFKDFNIILDANCSDITRMRIYSYDPNPYFNHNAQVYRKIFTKPAPTIKTYNQPSPSDTKSKVDSVIRQIKDWQIDITQHYKNEWFTLAVAFANEFGEEGRCYFHTISQYNGKYNTRDTDRQYDECLKHNYSQITIASFFKIASDYGIKAEHGCTNRLMNDSNVMPRKSHSIASKSKLSNDGVIADQQKEFQQEKICDSTIKGPYYNSIFRFPLFVDNTLCNVISCGENTYPKYYHMGWPELNLQIPFNQN